MVLIPAGLTGVLQPLDTHVFRQFRAKMQELWLAAKSNSERQLPMLEWVQVVAAAVDNVVISKDWRHAFERAGLLSRQALMAPARLREFGWETTPAVPRGLPSLGQACGMFPRNSTCNVAEWVHWRPVPSFRSIRTLD